MLTESDKDFCAAAGGIGIAISFVCIIQHFYMLPSFEWYILLFSVQFIFSVIALALLIRKSSAAPVCIIIAATLVFLYCIFLMLLYFSGVVIFSFILIILLAYLVTVSVLIYMRGLPEKLRFYQQQKKDELEYWNNKI
jgi:hypothetical protein